MADPHKDEHIEELLSKLQGIFGKLSHADEEESTQKVDPQKSAPPAPEVKFAPVSSPPSVTESANAPQPKEIPFDPPSAAAPPQPVASTPPPTNLSNGYTTLVPAADPEKMIVPTAVFFPTGKENEAKSLCGKLEMMTPKFTKVAFRLRVIVFLPYDPKSDWKDMLISKTGEGGCQTAFLVVDRSVDDAKKKAISSECEVKNIYFHDVPMISIEKKAYYTDILLGLVFFFDSRKPPESAQGDAA